jgi:hypothetical protein
MYTILLDKLYLYLHAPGQSGIASRTHEPPLKVYLLDIVEPMMEEEIEMGDDLIEMVIEIEMMAAL